MADPPRGYPEAAREVHRGEEPAAFWLVATVGVEDRYEAIDPFLDRLVELRVEEAPSVCVDARRTAAYEAAVLAASRQPAAVAALAPWDPLRAPARRRMGGSTPARG